MALFTLSRIPPREKNRAGVLSAILMLAAIGLTMSAFAQSAILAFAGLCMAACMQAAVPLFYSFPSQHFAGARAAVALALVNSVGNIGGFFGPYILGVFRQTFHTDTVGLVFLAGTFVIAACMALGLPRQLRSAEAQAGARA
ncbi:putative tartrate transporter [compost metagenome]